MTTAGPTTAGAAGPPAAGADTTGTPGGGDASTARRDGRVLDLTGATRFGSARGTTRTTTAPAPATPAPAAVRGPARDPELRSRVRAALDRACRHLLDQQDAAGWWKGELETNVTMDAEDLLMRQFLGVRNEEDTAASARWIRSQQRADGSWTSWYGGPAELSTTAEAYVALRLAGDRPDEPHMRAAAGVVRELGGLENTRVFTRIWLAMSGLWSWDDLPVMPPELVLLPDRFPLALPAWGCWARQTIVPLTIVGTLRPSRPVGFEVPELLSGRPRPVDAPLRTAGGAFERLDRVLHRYERRPLKVLRRHALRRAAEWIVARQEADGSWGGIQPPWVYSIMALHLLGYPLSHPVLAEGLAGLERFTIREETAAGTVRRLEACQSPVWDTGLALIGLADADVADPRVATAGRWLLDEEVRVKGDWAVRRPDLAPGGWAFEFDNDGYPDVDDTAVIVLALRRLAELGIDLPVDGPVGRAVRWVVGMQCRDGGWAAFDADQTGTLPTRLPFCDFGAVVDPPTADVTGHVVEMLAGEGLAGGEPCRRGVRWLLDHQEPDGSWWGRWGVNYVYGTGAVVPALVAAGVPRDSAAVRAAVHWLLDHQHQSGGWGETVGSYADPSLAGTGTPTASQTAWALQALLAAGGADEAVRRGVRWLIEQQRDDGGWDEPEFTGTGFPVDFTLNYHLYRLVFPVSALGRYLREPR